MQTDALVCINLFPRLWRLHGPSRISGNKFALESRKEICFFGRRRWQFCSLSARPRRLGGFGGSVADNLLLR
jgi:hypothetical protein